MVFIGVVFDHVITGRSNAPKDMVEPLVVYWNLLEPLPVYYMMQSDEVTSRKSTWI